MVEVGYKMSYHLGVTGNHSVVKNISFTVSGFHLSLIMGRRGELEHPACIPFMRIIIPGSECCILSDIVGYSPKLGYKVVFAVSSLGARLFSFFSLLSSQ